MESLIRIGLIDDDGMMMHGAQAWLGAQAGVAVPVAARTVDAFLAADPEVDVVVLDLALRDGSHHTDNIRRLVRHGLRVLVFSDCGDLSALVATVRAGAAGYLSREGDLELLLTTARDVVDGTHAVSAALAAALDHDRSPERRRIPQRCLEAVSLFVTGLSVWEVAAIMGIRPTTVETYIERVEADAFGPTADLGPAVGADVLLAGGHGSHAELVAPALQRVCGGRVTPVPAVAAARELRLGAHDVVVVDLLADPAARSRPPASRRSRSDLDRGDPDHCDDRRSPLDALPWQHSGLDVVESARSAAGLPEVVLWVRGVPEERLLIRWAAQELGVQVFCARAGGGLGTLPQAVAAAARATAHADRSLAGLLPARDAPRIADALFGSALRRGIWAALAAGCASDKEIGALNRCAPKTVRNHTVEMLRELQDFDPTVPPGGKPQTALLRWATEHRRFLLDASVRRTAARDDRPASRPTSPAHVDALWPGDRRDV